MMVKVIFWVALVIYTFAGVYVARFVKGTADFYVMGRRANWFLISSSFIATFVSAMIMLGMSGISYAGNLVPLLTMYGGVWVGTTLGIVWIGRRFRQWNFVTLPDFFDKRYGWEPVKVVATLIMITSLTGYGIIQLMGAGLTLAKVVGISYETMVLIFALSMALFLVAGGMWGLLVADALMTFTILFIAAVMAPLAIAKVGFGAVNELPPEFWGLEGTALSVRWVTGQWLLWAMGCMVLPWFVPRVLPARDDMTVIKSNAYIMATIMFIPTIIFTAAALLRSAYPGLKPPDIVWVQFFLHGTNPVFGGIALAGVMAAVVSTAAGIFIMCGFALFRDLWQKRLFPNMPERIQLIGVRLTMIAIILIGTLIAYTRPPAIYTVGAWAAGMAAAGWFTAVVGGMIWRRANSVGALASMVVGPITFVVVYQLDKAKLIRLPVDPFMVGIAAAIVVFIIVCLVTRPTPRETEMFAQMEAEKAEKKWVREILAQPNGLARLKTEYKQGVYAVVGSLVVTLAYLTVLLVKVGIPAALR